jgi:hypothetical protein
MICEQIKVLEQARLANLEQAPGTPRARALHEEISNDHKVTIYAATRGEVETRCRAFLRKWRLKCRAVADSLEEAGDKLFAYTRFPPSQAADQDPNPAAMRGNRCHVVLDAARLRSDYNAQGRRMADPRRETIRSDH